jgi:hypothetical protein
LCLSLIEILDPPMLITKTKHEPSLHAVIPSLMI